MKYSFHDRLGHWIQREHGERWRKIIAKTLYVIWDTRHETMCFYMREIYTYITIEHSTIKLLNEEERKKCQTTEFNGVHCHSLLVYRTLAHSFLSEYVRFIEFSHLIILIMVVPTIREAHRWKPNLFAINFTQTFIDLLNTTRSTLCVCSNFIRCLKLWTQNNVGNDVCLFIIVFFEKQTEKGSATDRPKKSQFIS